MKSWTDAAGEYLKIAEEAKLAGDDVVLIAAIQRAAECLQIARSLERCKDLLPNKRSA